MSENQAPKLPTLDDLIRSPFTFELESKKITFKMPLWSDAQPIQNAIFLLSTGDEKNIDLGNSRLLKYALKYAIVEFDGNKHEGLMLENFSALFKNPFAVSELQLQFTQYISSFLESLPSFQKLQNL